MKWLLEESSKLTMRKLPSWINYQRLIMTIWTFSDPPQQENYLLAELSIMQLISSLINNLSEVLFTNYQKSNLKPYAPISMTC